MEGRAAEDCVVLLEVLIQSNRKLAAENEKLRREHEAARRNQTQVLQRIEQRLNEREAPGERHRSRRRAAAPGCRSYNCRSCGMQGKYQKKRAFE